MAPSHSKFGCDGCLWIITHQSRSSGLGFGSSTKAAVRRTQQASVSPTEVCGECCPFFRFGIMDEGMMGDDFPELCRLWVQGTIKDVSQDAPLKVRLARIAREGFQLPETPKATGGRRLEEQVVRRVHNASVRKNRAAGAISTRGSALLRSDALAVQLHTWAGRETRQKLKGSFRRTVGTLVTLHKTSAEAVQMLLERLDPMEGVEKTGQACEWMETTLACEGEEDVDAMEGVCQWLGECVSSTPHARPFEVPQPASPEREMVDVDEAVHRMTLPGEFALPGTPMPFIPPSQAPQQEASSHGSSASCVMEIDIDLGLATPPPTPAAPVSRAVSETVSRTVVRPQQALPAVAETAPCKAAQPTASLAATSLQKAKPAPPAVPPRPLPRPQHAAAPVLINMIPSQQATPAVASTESEAPVPALKPRAIALTPAAGTPSTPRSRPVPRPQHAAVSVLVDMITPSQALSAATPAKTAPSPPEPKATAPVSTAVAEAPAAVEGPARRSRPVPRPQHAAAPVLFNMITPPATPAAIAPLPGTPVSVPRAAAQAPSGPAVEGAPRRASGGTNNTAADDDEKEDEDRRPQSSRPSKRARPAAPSGTVVGPVAANLNLHRPARPSPLRAVSSAAPATTAAAASSSSSSSPSSSSSNSTSTPLPRPSTSAAIRPRGPGSAVRPRPNRPAATAASSLTTSSPSPSTPATTSSAMRLAPQSGVSTVEDRWRETGDDPEEAAAWFNGQFPGSLDCAWTAHGLPIAKGRERRTK